MLVIGANFAGLAAALKMPRSLAVTVVDPSPYFEFIPNIHELVSGLKTSSQLRLQKEKILSRAGHNYLQEKVRSLHPRKGEAITETGCKIPFDVCLVTVGGVNNTFGVPGADRFALPFKSVRDCRRIGTKLEARCLSDRDISVVIVGGGLEGVESLGEILRAYRHRKGLSLHVVERNARLLPNQPELLDPEIRQLCRPYSVSFHTGESVAEVTARTVELASGQTLPSDLTLWTGGVKAPALLGEAGLIENGGG